MSRIVFVLVLLVHAHVSLETIRAEDWAGFRGSDGNGISSETTAPLNWSSTEGIRWKIQIPGVGRSSPIAVKDCLFVTTSLTEQQSRHLICIDRDSGEIRWNRLVHQGLSENQHKFNSSASATPTSDGIFVYSVFVDEQNMIVVATDWQGEIRWKRTVGTFFSKHGFAASPVLCRNGLIVNGHQDGEAFIKLLDKESGETIWTYKPDVNLRSFSTPVVAEVGGVPQIVLAGSTQTLGLKPETGERLWFVEGPTEKIVCSPSIGLGHVFSFGGSPQVRAFGIKIDMKSSAFEPSVVWKMERGMPYVPTPLLYERFIHVVDDLGIYSCIDPLSGKVLKTLRKGNQSYSSPVGAAGRVYLFDDTGLCTVIRNNSNYEVLAKNAIEDIVQTTPAISNGAMFVRGENYLWRIGP
ncbi:MAG: PQQ-binding-like beta-propeller repeat protein [Planctomycetes bacterium]|nr:PQQ-binding-like beta-propeller repeat protein [Planctomycetota bacterium]